MKASSAGRAQELSEMLGGEQGRLLEPRQAALHDELEALREAQHQRTKEGLPVWDLSMVNPDLAPPRPVLDRLLEAVTKTTNHRYAVSRGVRRLREAFSLKYLNAFGQALDPEKQVCVCLGSKDATFHALRVLIEPGDRVIVPEPAYPAHPSAVSLAGGNVVPWGLSEDPAEASTSLEALLRDVGAKVVLLNFPSNPAGVTVSELWWKMIGAVCARFGVTVINDFVYGEMTFSGVSAVSALSVTREGARCVEVYSLSKAYNVPGWRVGALVGDEATVRAVSRVKSLADYGLFLPLQYAATLALTASEDLVRPTTQTYARRLKVLQSGLEELGWRAARPGAGACLWAKYPDRLAEHGGPSAFRSINVARYLLTSVGLVVTPGIVFGARCDDWVRLAAVSNEERLRAVLGALRGMEQPVQIASGAS